MAMIKKVIKEKKVEEVAEKEEKPKEVQKPTLRELYGENPPLHVLNKLAQSGRNR